MKLSTSMRSFLGRSEMALSATGTWQTRSRALGCIKKNGGEKIAHTAIKFNNMTLMGSDVMNEEAPEGAPASFLVYSADSVPDADRVFAALSEGGTVLYPLEKQVWEAYDGRCIDRFGTAWEVMYEGQDL